jgi:precorrin-8X/cobalt-precorrin-8 methylmutase
VRRVIHSTADFELASLMYFSPGVIEGAIAAIRKGVPIVVDVAMIKVGVMGILAQTFANPLICAIEQAPAVPPPGKTRTEIGLMQAIADFPDGIFAIGNAPTALLALCSHLEKSPTPTPAVVIGAPVGFVSVVESKMALSRLSVPQIRIEGRKGGSPAATAILNALIMLAWES